MDHKHKGAASELIASAYFLSQGAEVFRNVSQHGPADLIVWYPETGETIFVDVKTGFRRVRPDGSIATYCGNPASTRCGVRIFIVLDSVAIGFAE